MSSGSVVARAGAWFGTSVHALTARGVSLGLSCSVSRHLCPAAVEYTSTSPAATTTDADAVFAFSGNDATGVNFTCTLAAR